MDSARVWTYGIARPKYCARPAPLGWWTCTWTVHVIEPAQNAITSADDQQRFAGEFRREVVTSSLHLVASAHELPCLSEKLLLLAFKESGIKIDIGRKRPGSSNSGIDVDLGIT